MFLCVPHFIFSLVILNVIILFGIYHFFETKAIQSYKVKRKKLYFISIQNSTKNKLQTFYTNHLKTSFKKIF